MKREELAPLLREEYAPGKPCGVEKVVDEDSGIANLWFVVPPRPPVMLPRDLPANALRRAHDALQKLPSFESADELDRTISYLFIRREAVQSSRIEGTWSTIDHVLTPGEVYDEQEGKSGRASVIGYAHALDQEIGNVAKKREQIFTTGLVRRLHREIMKKDPHFQGKAGELRAPGRPGSIVFIGGLRRKEDSIYNPAPPRRVARCLEETMAWMRDPELVELGDAGMGLSLPVRMALGHSHFEAVHPFRDGNGRVGRILVTLQMAAWGCLPLYLSGFIEEEKKEYYSALALAQKRLSYGKIVEFFSEAIVASHEEGEKTKRYLKALPETWRKTAKFRTASGSIRALDQLLTQPIFTVKRMSETLELSIPAANRAVAQLVEKGIVRERTGFGRNRIFAAEEVIALLSRKFGASPQVSLEHAQALMRK